MLAAEETQSRRWEVLMVSLPHRGLYLSSPYRIIYTNICITVILKIMQFMNEEKYFLFYFSLYYRHMSFIILVETLFIKNNIFRFHSRFIGDLVTLVYVDDSLWCVADYKHHHNPGEQGRHRVIPSKII